MPVVVGAVLLQHREEPLLPLLLLGLRGKLEQLPLRTGVPGHLHCRVKVPSAVFGQSRTLVECLAAPSTKKGTPNNLQHSPLRPAGVLFSKRAGRAHICSYALMVNTIK